MDLAKESRRIFVSDPAHPSFEFYFKAVCLSSEHLIFEVKLQFVTGPKIKELPSRRHDLLNILKGNVIFYDLLSFKLKF